MTENTDWKKRYESLRARKGGPVASSTPFASTAHEDFEIIKDEFNRDVAIPKKSFTEKRQQKWDKMRELHPGLPAMMGVVRFNDFQRKIYDDLCCGFKNAILFGPAGTGKTQVALAALHNLCMGARTVLALRFTEIKRRMEPRQVEADRTTPLEVLSKMTEPEYLLIDEVGYGQSDRKHISEHERQVLFDIVSERDAFDLQTWLTTNMTLEGLEDVYGDATISRLGKWDGCVKADFSDQPNFRYRKI